jgi:hypothetical protein
VVGCGDDQERGADRHVFSHPGLGFVTRIVLEQQIHAGAEQDDEKDHSSRQGGPDISGRLAPLHEIGKQLGAEDREHHEHGRDVAGSQEADVSDENREVGEGGQKHHQGVVPSPLENPEDSQQAEHGHHGRGRHPEPVQRLARQGERAAQGQGIDALEHVDARRVEGQVRTVPLVVEQEVVGQHEDRDEDTGAQEDVPVHQGPE